MTRAQLDKIKAKIEAHKATMPQKFLRGEMSDGDGNYCVIGWLAHEDGVAVDDPDLPAWDWAEAFGISMSTISRIDDIIFGFDGESSLVIPAVLEMLESRVVEEEPTHA